MTAVPGDSRRLMLVPPPERAGRRLPAQPTPLIGRDADIAAVAARLLDPAVRLLTLTGPGGAGKTRLALAAAEAVADQFDHGIVFVDLTPVREPALVITTIARALALTTSGGDSVAAVLAGYLDDKQLVLLLDNCEQVLGAAPALAALLEGSRRFTILATSRSPLHLRWEHQMAVSALALPDPCAGSRSVITAEDVARIGDSPAVQLFVARARAVRPGFTLTEENAQAVAGICVRLDGLPLAIELAAARGNVFPPEALVARLARRLELLTAGAADQPERHQTLRDALTWSVEILTAAEQRLFRRLAVFAGGCTVDACAAVMAEGEDRVIEGLTSLVDHNLLRQEATVAEPRFGMLETMREYAGELLTASGELAVTQQRHASYFVALAEQAEPLLKSGAQLSWRARLEAEHPNLRAAVEWSLAHDQPELALRLAGAMAWFWHARTAAVEGWRWLDAALAQTAALGATPARAKALYGAGFIARYQGDAAVMRARYEQCEAMSRALGDRRGLGFALSGQAVVAEIEGDMATWRARHDEGYAAFAEAGDPWGRAWLLIGEGRTAVARGDIAAARAAFEESIMLFRQVGDAWTGAHPLQHLGGVAALEGNDTLARSILTDALALHRGAGDAVRGGGVLISLGDVARRQGDAAGAAARFAEGLTTFRELGNRERIAQALAGFARLAATLGQLERSARWFGAAGALLETLGTRMPTFDPTRKDHQPAAVRAALGEDAWATAWTAGRTLSRGQAIAEALAFAAELAVPPAAARADRARSSDSSGGKGLSTREAEVLRLLAGGLSNKEIAAGLALSVHTVERHVVNIYAKIGVRGRADAVAHALRHGLA